MNVFDTRLTAGMRLGSLLEAEYKDRHALILGIAGGGMIVAHEVAKMLQGELNTIVVEPLLFPGHKELRVGAVSEHHAVHTVALSSHLTQQEIDHLIEEKSFVVQARTSFCRQAVPLPLLSNRVVILVDDGMGTGITMAAALKSCCTKGASMLVVAVPVANDRYSAKIASLADDIKILEQRDDLYSVGQAYESFPEVPDVEVHRMLQKFQKGYRSINETFILQP